jgi:hypothetical protein
MRTRDNNIPARHGRATSAADMDSAADNVAATATRNVHVSTRLPGTTGQQNATTRANVADACAGIHAHVATNIVVAASDAYDNRTTFPAGCIRRRHQHATRDSVA